MSLAWSWRRRLSVSAGNNITLNDENKRNSKHDTKERSCI